MLTPYEFDGPYAAGYEHDRSGCMDERHVYLLHDLLLAGGFVKALEIGCYYGASSSAFVEAVEKNPSLHVTFCDIAVGQELVDVAGRYENPRVRVAHMSSVQALSDAADYDFIVVDGSHDLKSVSLELPFLLNHAPRCIVAHDTSATDHGYEACEGAKLLKAAFSMHPDYRCLEDSEVRDDEATQRGLFLATRDDKFYGRAVDLFQSWARWTPEFAGGAR